jgi:hypothetical protein
VSGSERWSRLAGVFIAAVALALVLAVLVPRFLGAAAGPEATIITALKRTERDGLELALPGVGAPLTSSKHYFARITVRVEPGAQRAEALATLDFTGRLGDTEVSSLGVERVPFVLSQGEWVPEGLATPRLAAVVAALEARRRALEAGDRSALRALVEGGEDGGGPGAAVEEVLALRKRRYRAEAWYIRLERDEAVASEHWRLEGELPSRPVDERGQRQYRLVRSGEQFLFSPSLM